MVSAKSAVSVFIKMDSVEVDSVEEDDFDVELVVERLKSMFHHAVRGCPRFNRVCRGRFGEGMRQKKFYWCFQNGLNLMENGDEESLLHAKNFFFESTSIETK